MIDLVLTIHTRYVAAANALLKYFLPYKIRQDHSELFFGVVHAALGRNSNPTVRQFVSIYKRMLIRHNVQGGLVNCIALDETHILPAASVAADARALVGDAYEASIAQL